MTACATPSKALPVSDTGGPLLYGGSEIVVVAGPNIPQEYTDRCEVDARTALTRALSDYLKGLIVDAPAGRKMVFDGRVFDTYPDNEVEAKFPSAFISVVGPATYDAASLVPNLNPFAKLDLPDGRYLVQLSELTAIVVVDVWATDIKGRAALVNALESALCPFDWMYGVRLDVPYYYGARATYELRNIEYTDGDEMSARRFRRAQLELNASIPVIRLVGYPDARPRIDLDVQ
jgi:hypothetical protein